MRRGPAKELGPDRRIRGHGAARSKPVAVRGVARLVLEAHAPYRDNVDRDTRRHDAGRDGLAPRSELPLADGRRGNRWPHSLDDHLAVLRYKLRRGAFPLHRPLVASRAARRDDRRNSIYWHHADLSRKVSEAWIVLIHEQERIDAQFHHARIARFPGVIQPPEHLI